MSEEQKMEDVAKKIFAISITIAQDAGITLELFPTLMEVVAKIVRKASTSFEIERMIDDIERGDTKE